MVNRWRDINCLYPFYDNDGGNYTKISFSGCTTLVDNRKTKTVLKDLAKFFAADLKSLRHKYGQSINRKRSIPIPFHAELILLGVRVREPQHKDEGAVAYINSGKVKAINPLDHSLYRTAISFKDGSSIKVLQSVVSVKALLKDSDIVKESYLNLYHVNSGREQKIKESLSNFLELVQNKEGLYL